LVSGKQENVCVGQQLISRDGALVVVVLLTGASENLANNESLLHAVAIPYLPSRLCRTKNSGFFDQINTAPDEEALSFGTSSALQNSVQSYQGFHVGQRVITPSNEPGEPSRQGTIRALGDGGAMRIKFDGDRYHTCYSPDYPFIPKPE